MFKPGNEKVIQLINSVAYLSGEVSALGTEYSILNSVEDALINKIKEADPSSFSPSDQSYITTWTNNAMADRQNQQQNDYSGKLLPGFQR